MAKHLFEEWAWGRVSLQQAQLLAQLAKHDIDAALEVDQDDGVTFPLLEQISELGSSGKHSGNMHRDMVNTLPPTPIPEVGSLKVYTKRGPGQPNIITDQAILYPHELFACIYTYYPKVFFSRFVPSVDILGIFWKDVSDTPQYKEHPLIARPDF